MSRTQRAYQTVADTGVLTVNVYSLEKDADGRQLPFTALTFPTADLPAKMLSYCAAKGLGFYMQSRYSATEEDDPSPQEVVDRCNALFTEMEAGTFTPGRGGGEARPTPFHEALAEHLKVPVHVIVAKIKDQPLVYTKGKLVAMAKVPAIAMITARITKERAQEAEKKMRAKAREAGKIDDDLFGDLGEGAGVIAA